MTAKTKTSSKPRSTRRAASSTRRPVRAISHRRAPMDAIQLLKSDHAKVDALFKQYEKARAPQKEKLVQTICQELKVHTQIEEEIFYPALRSAATQRDDAGDLLDEASVEHNSAKQLISELEAGSPGDELFDAKVKVLGEYIRHHVKEEHRDIFPLARKRLDVKALGAQLAQRKTELMETMDSGVAIGGKGLLKSLGDRLSPSALHH
ncbi:hemerythrin domain-containing protein [Solimonas sp. SE-A11]|uniref:hemerythrin domain-containing protein n=1 Tax=Solimonas sp. SE-A11 TaxID=3054954 RepID=UPI00259CC40E|nr:hemerythrin domain-containing protein [Solimonas sp. SE-A11]MDM4771567.1 hemerythrin domain-containing protein [Solimonas sp. SE-A11]